MFGCTVKTTNTRLGVGLVVVSRDNPEATNRSFTMDVGVGRSFGTTQKSYRQTKQTLSETTEYQYDTPKLLLPLQNHLY